MKQDVPASFDCFKEQRKIEKTISSDANLSALDSVLGVNYNELINKIYSEDKFTKDSKLDEMKNCERKWIRQYRKDNALKLIVLNHET